MTPVSEAAAAAAKKLTIRLPSQNQHRGANAKLASEACHPGDNNIKKSAEEADDVTEILDAPKSSKKKRKKKKAHQSDTASEDSDTEPKKKKKKVKTRRSSIGSDMDAGELPKTKKTSHQPENVSAEADTEVPVAQPKKRGRPRKIVDDTPVAPKVWSVSVFVEIASPPKLQTGKTPRSIEPSTARAAM